ncbi:hypothetical protein BGZ57DRAFT_1385 [Hyaloscypha finlandica]|nr:hypothetical protein BGZ57DRAFT_1385 [Hyaloscypha finlandica]
MRGNVSFQPSSMMLSAILCYATWSIRGFAPQDALQSAKRAILDLLEDACACSACAFPRPLFNTPRRLQVVQRGRSLPSIHASFSIQSFPRIIILHSTYFLRERGITSRHKSFTSWHCCQKHLSQPHLKSIHEPNIKHPAYYLDSDLRPY